MSSKKELDYNSMTLSMMGYTEDNRKCSNCSRYTIEDNIKGAVPIEMCSILPYTKLEINGNGCCNHYCEKSSRPKIINKIELTP